MKRTDQQRKAIEVDCKNIAEALNMAGLEMRVILKGDVKIWWTQGAVKEYLFKPLMKAMYQKESTTELEKHMEIDKIHDQLMHILGEKHGLEYIPFPHDPEKQKQKQYMGAPKVEYPKEDYQKTAFE